METLLVIASLLILSTTAAEQLVVQTAQGKLQGHIGLAGLAREFRGVPYATPPVGSLRWSAPQPHKPWNNTIDASSDAPGCMQACNLPPHTCPPTMSEDCLFVNVFTPLGGQTGLPVMVWFHGGNFRRGYAGGPLYDGSWIANKTSTIVVAVQYRLGIFGFLYSDKLGLQGNYGIQDQQLALRWVQQNIAAFGGDKDRVTIWGQSAGAMSVGIHLQSPASKGLFHRAILESDYALPLRTPKTWEGVVTSLEGHVNCKNQGLACMKAVDSAGMLAGQVAVSTDILTDLSHILQVFMPYTPTKETALVPQTPIDAFANGSVTDVPILMGNTAQEAVVFIYEGFKKPVSKLEYDVLLGFVFGISKAFKVGKEYPLPSGVTVRNHTSLVATEGIFICPNRNATRSVDGRKSPIYLYVYDHVMTFGKQAWGKNDSMCWDAVCHASELPFVWAALEFNPLFNWTMAEANLANQMVAYWTNFVHTGDPNQFPFRQAPVTSSAISGPWPPKLVNWPAYKTATSQSMRLKIPLQVDSFYLNDHCNFWDSEIGYDFP